MLGEGLGGGPLKDKMLDGPDVLFPDTYPNDTKVVGGSEDLFKVQHIIELDNGLKMSVIRGDHTYGGPKLWEIAPMDSDRNFIGQSELGWGDDVRGHFTLQEVYRQCQLMENLYD